MWIKILCIEYILWGIPTIESTFDVANMVKTATVKDVPIKKWCASKHTGLLNSCLGKLCLHPYLVVPLISAKVTLIFTRVSAHCQAILLRHKARHQHWHRWWLVAWQHQAISSAEPMLTYHQWGIVAFTWGQFYRKCSRYLSLIWV